MLCSSLSYFFCCFFIKVYFFIFFICVLFFLFCFLFYFFSFGFFRFFYFCFSISHPLCLFIFSSFHKAIYEEKDMILASKVFLYPQFWNTDVSAYKDPTQSAEFDPIRSFLEDTDLYYDPGRARKLFLAGIKRVKNKLTDDTDDYWASLEDPSCFSYSIFLYSYFYNYEDFLTAHKAMFLDFEKSKDANKVFIKNKKINTEKKFYLAKDPLLDFLNKRNLLKSFFNKIYKTDIYSNMNFSNQNYMSFNDKSFFLTTSFDNANFFQAHEVEDSAIWVFSLLLVIFSFFFVFFLYCFLIYYIIF